VTKKTHKISTLIDGTSRDPEDARRRKLLNIMLFAVGIAAIFMFIVLVVTAYLGLAGQPHEVFLLGSGIGVALLGAAVIYAINRYGSGEMASLLFIILLITISAFSDNPAHVANGRGLLLFAIPILAASVLLRPWASYIAAALSSIVIAVIGITIVDQPVPNIPAMTGFFILATVSWLSAHNLESALKDVRTRDEQLRENQEKLRSVLDSSPDAITVTDLRGVIVDCNHATVELLGAKKRNEIIGKSSFDFFADEDKGKAVEEMRETFDQEINRNIEYSLFRLDGKRVPAELSASVIRDAEGKVTGYVALTKDITERKQNQLKLERLNAAIEHASESIIVTDPSGIIQYANPAFEKTTGFSREEAVGQNMSLIKSGEQDEIFYNELWATISSGESWQGRITNKRKDGALYTQETAISSVLDNEGHIINYVGVMRDITEELEREEQYNQAQKMESIGRLAGGVAHDLNNLLTPILGYGEMLQSNLDKDDKRSRFAQEIVQAGTRARNLVRQLLAFSRKQTLEYTPVDVNASLERFYKLLRRTIREDIDIRMKADSPVGTIQADIGQIEQVVMNLAVNAQDAMPDGGTLTIETSEVNVDKNYVSTHKEVEPGPYVLLAISDTGEGMDEEIRDHVFEPFYTTKALGKGTGLGLATVYGIIKQHGGHIWVYSEPGQGTTFKIYLPVSNESKAGKEEQVKITSQAHLRGTETILLVEDDKKVRTLAQSILKEQGYNVLIAENATEALSLLQDITEPVDLLLTDVVMPGMSGKDLFDHVSKHDPDIKVLYMSGYTDEVISHRGVIDEGINFIQKPFNVKMMAAKVREILDR